VKRVKKVKCVVTDLAGNVATRQFQEKRYWVGLVSVALLMRQPCRNARGGASLPSHRRGIRQSGLKKPVAETRVDAGDRITIEGNTKIATATGMRITYGPYP
jgi:hypothetical protein